MAAVISSVPSWIPAVAGVASHWFFFKRGERHLNPLAYVQFLVFSVFTAVVIIRISENDVPTHRIALYALRIAGIYLAGLYGSLVTFRLFLNPLNKFPGPYRARLTAFDIALRLRGSMRRHLYLNELHQKHGKFVRIGPNDLSVTDPDGVQIVHGPNSKCQKAQWYSAESPASSLHTTRDRVDHDRRRRIWSPAFSIKALRGYENRIQRYNDLLLERFEAFSGQPVDVSKWFNFWSFDVMGDLGFGKSFHMLESGEAHWAIKLLNDAQAAAGHALPVWFTRLLKHWPNLLKDYFRFVKYCAQQVEDRIIMQGKQKDPDITHTLIEDFNKRDPAERQLARQMLYMDSKLIIVAGSDTTAATLAYLFYYLAVTPGLIQRLREEFDQLRQEEEGELDDRKLQRATLLNGCINEALRLNPPVPSGVYRKTPPEGLYIGQTYILGNTTIQMPSYAMARDESIYAQAESFIPERFSSQPHLIKHKEAFNPFSTGPFGCIGKNLAYMELRTLTCQLVTRFDVALAPGEDGSAILFQSHDHFTTGLKPCYLVFSKRG